jgi:flavin-dependent dehydrogenase
VSADVVVVGAGPAGSALAILLARGGLDVSILDKSVNGLPAKVCGEYLSPGCVSILERLGLLAPLRELARSLRGMIIHAARGEILRAAYPDTGRIPGETHGLSLPRTVLDPFVLDQAIKTGARYDPGVQVSEISRTGSLVEVRGRRRGVEVTRRARLVVGADGRHSVVARASSIVRPHRWLDKVALVAYVKGVSRDEHYGEIFLGPDRYAILNPIADGVTNLGFVMSRRDLPSSGGLRETLWSMARSLPALAPRLQGATLAAPARCLGPLAHRAVPVSGLRFLLVGDAAGFLDPFTGEGIYAALRSAELAAHRILSGWGRDGPCPDAVAAYARDWSREFEPKWRFATHLQRAIRHPVVARGVIRVLRRRPALAAILLAAAGDLIPPQRLSLAHLLLRRGAQHGHSQA